MELFQRDARLGNIAGSGSRSERTPDRGVRGDDKIPRLLVVYARRRERRELAGTARHAVESRVERRASKCHPGQCDTDGEYGENQPSSQDR